MCQSDCYDNNTFFFCLNVTLVNKETITEASRIITSLTEPLIKEPHLLSQLVKSTHYDTFNSIIDYFEKNLGDAKIEENGLVLPKILIMAMQRLLH